MNFTINSPLTLTYSVSACEHAMFNGEHTETFDLSTLTSDDLTQYIAQTLIIKRQSMLRSKTAFDAETGIAKITVGNWLVPAPGKRISTTPVQKMQVQMDKLTSEQLKAFRDMILAKLEEEEA
jgi:hypothetical protein